MDMEMNLILSNAKAVGVEFGDCKGGNSLLHSAQILYKVKLGDHRIFKQKSTIITFILPPLDDVSGSRQLDLLHNADVGQGICGADTDTGNGISARHPGLKIVGKTLSFSDPTVLLNHKYCLFFRRGFLVDKRGMEWPSEKDWSLAWFVVPALETFADYVVSR
jgi:hypothetical protein